MSAENITGKNRWVRVDGIDLLRGLAILLVLMNHVNMRLFLAKIPYTHAWPDQLASSLVWNGQYGVQMFFAVSGFLITSMSLRRWHALSHIGLSSFYRLRFARIVPLLLLLLVILSGLHAAGFEDYRVSAKTGGLGRAVIAALTFHVNVLEADRGYLPGNWDVLWSLSVEEVFYVFFPVICWMFGRGRGKVQGEPRGQVRGQGLGRSYDWRLIAVLILFVVLGPIARTVFAQGNEVWREYSYLGGMDAIAWGCLTAFVVSRAAISRPGLRCLCALGAALLIFSLAFSNQAEAWGLVRAGLDMSVLAVGTCLVIVAAAKGGWTSPRLLMPVKALGRYSYEVYLTHMFIVYAMFRLFVAAGKPPWAIAILFIAVILIAGLLGRWVAKGYSEPMNRLIRGYGRSSEESAKTARSAAPLL